ATPDTLTVRELATTGKVLVTTLRDAKATPKHEIKKLYKERWHVEVDFRNLKTTLGMAHLRAKSPQMARKELWVYLLAYNLIRWLMRASARWANVLPRMLSFKHAVNLLGHWRSSAPLCTPPSDSLEALLVLIAQQRVGNRSGRIEPRAVKRRPKPYALLMMPRAKARQSIRQFGRSNRKAGQNTQC